MNFKVSLKDDKLKAKVSVGYKVSGGSSNGGVVVVDELPTIPKENVLYQVNKVSDVDVYIKTGDYLPSTLEGAIKSLGVTPNLKYYVVNSLPETPNISDLQTFNPASVYIYNDIAYTYGNAGYGNMWLEVKDLVSQSMNLQYENKGYVNSLIEVVKQGIYVTYKLGKQGVYYKEKYDLIEYNGAWLDYKGIFDKSIKKLYAPNIKTIYHYAFLACYNLTYVDLPDVLYIRALAFASCENLVSVRLQKILEFEDVPFAYCDNLKDLYIGSEVVPIITINTFNDLERINVHVRAELLSAYQADSNWKHSVASGNVTLIGDYTD